MDRFVSHFTHRLDAKGRVSIPAPFRAVLMRETFDGLFVHPALDATALDCGGTGLLGTIDTLLARYPPYSTERDTLATALLGESEILKVDAEGRVILSDTLKARGCIAAEATFVGQGYKFQIWEPERFRAHLEEARSSLRDLRKRLGTRLAEISPSPSGARE